MTWIPELFLGFAAAAVVVSYLLQPVKPATEATENLRERVTNE